MRPLAPLLLACLGASAAAQGGMPGLLRDALKALPERQAPAASQQGQAPAAPAPADGAAPAAPQMQAQAPASTAAMPDIEQWSTQLPPASPASPYVALPGLRFEAFSNPCPDGKGRCWVPIVQLPVSGRLPTGQEVHVAYRAGGRPWFTERFRGTDATALLRDRNNTWLLYRFRSGRNQEHLARHTGRIEFEVTHVDALNGSARKMAGGHFNVGKEARRSDVADNVDYYVSYDWATEMVTVDFMGSGNPNLDYPGLTVNAVFLQPVEKQESMSLHLFHGGKEIASATRWRWGEGQANARNGKTREGYGAVETVWALPNVVAYDRRPDKGPGFFVVGENPGEYTVKILRNGELAREAKFMVTADGRIDRSLNIAGNLPHGYTVLRAKALGTQDRARANFRADGFWGNAAGLK
ncbi:hypothetical protein [Ramlibacter sp. Leaf400]|uniref:hypothetical protein n=1 Tax=Ramlibacter sp. Leaf400 TaxID=1736365 RepID=UPI0012E3F567|nr:hypothetical protein [Ramlibacter sp. Leaf400]